MATRQSLPGFGKAFDRADQFVGHGPDATALPFRSHTSTSRVSLVQTADEFEALFRDGIRQMRRSVLPLDRPQVRLLDDVTRGRGIGMLGKVLEIARYQCADPTDATAVPEVCRGFVLAGHRANTTVFAAGQLETDANCDFDHAQLAYEHEPTRANYERLIEAGNRQINETRRVMDAAHAEQKR
jgi:hypothetical protein